MGRPKTPLISRRKVLQTALDIIDAKGLDALNIRGLADELGVFGASLYHHFASKDEIVVGATELALENVNPPTDATESWRVWLPRMTDLFREAILAHPELIPIVTRKGDHGMGAQRMEIAASLLVAEGVPLRAVVPVMDALEMLAIGSAIRGSRGDEGFSLLLGEKAVLTRAERSRSLSLDEVYEVGKAALMESIEQAAASRPARRPRRKAVTSTITSTVA